MIQKVLCESRQSCRTEFVLWLFYLNSRVELMTLTIRQIVYHIIMPSLIPRDILSRRRRMLRAWLVDLVHQLRVLVIKFMRKYIQVIATVEYNYNALLACANDTIRENTNYIIDKLFSLLHSIASPLDVQSDIAYKLIRESNNLDMIAKSTLRLCRHLKSVILRWLNVPCTVSDQLQR